MNNWIFQFLDLLDPILFLYIIEYYLYVLIISLVLSFKIQDY